MKPLRILIIGLVVAALVAGIAIPTLASGNNPAPTSTAYQMAPEKGNKGKVGKENGDKDTGNKGKAGQVQQASRTQIIKGIVEGKSNDTLKIGGKEVIANNQTRYHVPGVKNPGLADIKVGMYVVAQTTVKDGKNNARQIEVVPGKSLQRYDGKVTAFSYTPPVSGNVTDNATVSGSITILDKSGKTLSFDIIGGQFRVRPQGETVQVGDQVTVIARRAPADQNKLVAVGVIINHPTQQVSGNITALDETNKTITVGSTSLKYNDKTLFELHGVPSVKVGQAATAWYREQADHSLLAQRVRVK